MPKEPDEDCRCGEDDSFFFSPIVNQDLARYFAKFNQDQTIKSMFVPFCGRVVDMKWLYDRGIAITGCEIVEKAVKLFFENQSITPKVTEHSQGDTQYKVYSNEDGKLKIICGDMYKIPREEIGQHDAVYEMNAFQSLKQPDKERYLSLVASVLKPKGKLLAVISIMDCSEWFGGHDHGHEHKDHGHDHKDHGRDHKDHGHDHKDHGGKGHCEQHAQKDHGGKGHCERHDHKDHGGEGHHHHHHEHHGHHGHHEADAHQHGADDEEDYGMVFTEDDLNMFSKHYNMELIFDSKVNKPEPTDPPIQPNYSPDHPMANLERKVYFGVLKK